MHKYYNKSTLNDGAMDKTNEKDNGKSKFNELEMLRNALKPSDIDFDFNETDTVNASGLTEWDKEAEQIKEQLLLCYDSLNPSERSNEEGDYGVDFFSTFGEEHDALFWYKENEPLKLINEKWPQEEQSKRLCDLYHECKKDVQVTYFALAKL
jgi:hypothetical protein